MKLTERLEKRLAEKKAQGYPEKLLRIMEKDLIKAMRMTKGKDVTKSRTK